MRRMGVRFSQEGKNETLPGLLDAEDPILCSESEKDLSHDRTF